MSHIITIATKVKDPAAIVAACRRLNLPDPVHGTTPLFGGPVTGLLLRLPGWRYPVAIDTTLGTLQYDNFEGRWGEAAQLNRFLQRYAVEKARIEASQRGHQVTEQQLADGSIQLTIQEGF